MPKEAQYVNLLTVPVLKESKEGFVGGGKEKRQSDQTQAHTEFCMLLEVSFNNNEKICTLSGGNSINKKLPKQRKSDWNNPFPMVPFQCLIKSYMGTIFYCLKCVRVISHIVNRWPLLSHCSITTRCFIQRNGLWLFLLHTQELTELQHLFSDTLQLINYIIQSILLTTCCWANLPPLMQPYHLFTSIVIYFTKPVLIW